MDNYSQEGFKKSHHWEELEIFIMNLVQEWNDTPFSEYSDYRWRPTAPLWMSWISSRFFRLKNLFPIPCHQECSIPRWIMHPSVHKLNTLRFILFGVTIKTPRIVVAEISEAVLSWCECNNSYSIVTWNIKDIIGSTKKVSLMALLIHEIKKKSKGN